MQSMLKVVDQAYGSNADLYNDVLKVSPTSSTTLLQQGFFQRRKELFRSLNEGDLEAEQQMDALVVAFRIIDDPEQRSDYDKLREGRVKNNTSISTEDSNAFNTQFPEAFTESPKSTSREQTSQNGAGRIVTPAKEEQLQQQQQSKHASQGGELTDTSMEDQTYTSNEPGDWNDESTLQTLETVDEVKYSRPPSRQRRRGVQNEEGWSTRGIIRNVKEEVSGAYEDTCGAFHQVFNVFTLTDSDIRAVKGQIRRAEYDLSLEK